MNPAEKARETLGMASCTPQIGCPFDGCGIPHEQHKRCPLRPRLTQKEHLKRMADVGRELQQKKAAEYWKSLEAQLPQSAQEQIFKTTLRFQHLVSRGLMKESLGIGYRKQLIRIALMVHGQIQSVNLVAQALAVPKLKGQQKQLISAYNHFRTANGITAGLELRRDRRKPLPILTPESTLQASLTLPQQPHWITYFRLRYETGPRPCEPFQMRKKDIDFDRNLVRFGTFKGSGETLERELPVSPLCTEQLRILTAPKSQNDYVFTKPTNPTKPLDYKDASEKMILIRKQLQATGYNIKGLDLYVYRHAFATRLYQATKELPVVQRALGHRLIEDTMIYIHLQPDQIKRYDVENYPLTDKPAIGLKIAEGWEVAVQTPQEIWFKRPRWVP